MSVFNADFTSSRPFRTERTSAEGQFIELLEPVIQVLKKLSAHLVQTAFCHALMEKEIPHRFVTKQITPDERQVENKEALEVLYHTFKNGSKVTADQPEYLEKASEATQLISDAYSVVRSSDDPDLTRYCMRKGIGNQPRLKLFDALKDKILQIQVEFIKSTVADVIEAFASKQMGKVTRESYNELVDRIGRFFNLSMIQGHIEEKIGFPLTQKDEFAYNFA